MRRCLSCDARFSASIEACPVCDVLPPMLNGFRAYAPELAHSGGGFEARHFSALARLEASSFWFRARNRLILWALETYAQSFRSLLEIGCGTGYVLSGIAQRFPDREIHGSEVFLSGLDFAATRLAAAKFMQMDARNIPFAEEFDVIGAFDVLEHIAEDQRVLRQCHLALKPQGILLLTVPQHEWLWSAVDVHACHVRRYAAADLHRKVEEAGFRVLRSTSFVSTLLPAMMVARFLKRKAGAGASAELETPGWLDSLFSGLLAVELALIKQGFDLPVGGSRLLVARKT